MFMSILFNETKSLKQWATITVLWCACARSLNAWYPTSVALLFERLFLNTDHPGSRHEWNTEQVYELSTTCSQRQCPVVYSDSTSFFTSGRDWTRRKSGRNGFVAAVTRSDKNLLGIYRRISILSICFERILIHETLMWWWNAWHFLFKLWNHTKFRTINENTHVLSQEMDQLHTQKLVCS